MATDLGSLVYTLKLDDAGFTGQLNSAKEEVSSSSSGMTNSLKETEEASGGLKGAFSSMAGQFVVGQAVFSLGQKALGAITDTIKEGIQAAKDWQVQQAGLNQELSSTHDASGMTAEEVKHLAEETQNKTAIDKSAVLTGQNMLLTFTNIGKGAFPGATQAMVDMATRMNGGLIPNSQMLSSTAIQLGKALNDPTTGLNALHRVGVTFTDQQKEQIKTMQSSGDMMGAQQVILSELGREFGGEASANMKTFTGQFAMLKLRFSDMIAEAIPKLLNALKSIGDWIVQHQPVMWALIGVVGGLAIAIGVALVTALWGVVAPALAAVAVLWPIIAIGAAVGAVGYEIYTHWNEINKALKPVYEFFDKNIKPVLKEIWSIVKEQLIAAWKDLEKAFDSIMKTIKPFEPILKDIAIAIGIALVAPIVLAVAAIVGLIAAVVAIGVFLARLVGWIADAIAWFVKFEVGLWTSMVHAVEAVVGVGASIVNWFIQLPGHILGVLAGAAGWLWNTGVSIVQGLVNGIVAMAGAIWNGIKSVADGIGRFFGGAGSWLWDTGRSIIQGLINGLDNMAGAVENKIKSIGKGITDTAKNILKIFSPSRVFDEEIGQQITAGLAQGIDTGASDAIQSTVNMTNKVVAVGNDSLNGVQSPAAAMAQATGSMTNAPVYNIAKVELSTADAVQEFFSIGNRSLQLALMGGSPLAGTTQV